jgi:hypothetical protein
MIHWCETEGANGDRKDADWHNSCFIVCFINPPNGVLGDFDGKDRR